MLVPTSLPLSIREISNTGKPLMVLHGLLGSSRNWQSAGVALAQHGYRVLALDLRNHGASPWSEDCTYAALAADVIATLERLALGPTHIIGHSMGGKVAMRLVMDRPDLVAQLTVVDIAPRRYSDRVRVEFDAMNALDLSSVTSRKDADAKLSSQVPEWGMRQFILTNLTQAADGQWRWTVNREALTRSLPDILGNPLAYSETWKGPTRFICGGNSAYIQKEDFELIHHHFPKADIATIEGSGHNPHFDAREAFVRATLGV